MKPTDVARLVSNERIILSSWSLNYADSTITNINQIYIEETYKQASMKFVLRRQIAKVAYESSI